MRETPCIFKSNLKPVGYLKRWLVFVDNCVISVFNMSSEASLQVAAETAEDTAARVLTLELSLLALVLGRRRGAVEEVDLVHSNTGVEGVAVVVEEEDDSELVAVAAEPDLHLGPHPVRHEGEVNIVQRAQQSQLNMTQHWRQARVCRFK